MIPMILLKVIRDTVYLKTTFHENKKARFRCLLSFANFVVSSMLYRYED